jgi:hypothetical protein
LKGKLWQNKQIPARYRARGSRINILPRIGFEARLEKN